MGRREKQGLWDGPVHTAVFKMDNQQGPTVQQGNSAQCYVAAWIDEELGGEWIHVHVWLSLSAVHLYCHNIANQPYSNTK